MFRTTNTIAFAKSLPGTKKLVSRLGPPTDCRKGKRPRPYYSCQGSCTKSSGIGKLDVWATSCCCCRRRCCAIPGEWPTGIVPLLYLYKDPYGDLYGGLYGDISSGTAVPVLYKKVRNPFLFSWCGSVLSSQQGKQTSIVFKKLHFFRLLLHKIAPYWYFGVCSWLLVFSK